MSQQESFNAHVCGHPTVDSKQDFCTDCLSTLRKAYEDASASFNELCSTGVSRWDPLRAAARRELDKIRIAFANNAHNAAERDQRGPQKRGSMPGEWPDDNNQRENDGIRVRAQAVRIEDLETHRPESAYRDSESYRRGNPSYSPGRWADKSGNGFYDTSGRRDIPGQSKSPGGPESERVGKSSAQESGSSKRDSTSPPKRESVLPRHGSEHLARSADIVPDRDPANEEPRLRRSESNLNLASDRPSLRRSRSDLNLASDAPSLRRSRSHLNLASDAPSPKRSGTNLNLAGQGSSLRRSIAQAFLERTSREPPQIHNPWTELRPESRTEHHKNHSSSSAHPHPHHRSSGSTRRSRHEPGARSRDSPEQSRAALHAHAMRVASEPSRIASSSSRSASPRDMRADGSERSRTRNFSRRLSIRSASPVDGYREVRLDGRGSKEGHHRSSGSGSGSGSGR